MTASANDELEKIGDAEELRLAFARQDGTAAAEVELAAVDLREIDEALPEAQGARYSEANERMIDR